MERRLRGLGRVGGVFCGEVPGEQIGDATDRVVSDAVQDLAEIAFWIETVEFGRATSE